MCTRGQHQWSSRDCNHLTCDLRLLTIFPIIVQRELRTTLSRDPTGQLRRARHAALLSYRDGHAQVTLQD
jgi:hypothetical protein